MAHQREATDEEDVGGEGDWLPELLERYSPGGETGRCAVGGDIANILKGGDASGG